MIGPDLQLLSPSAFPAYLDPATGSLLVSLVVGASAAAFFMLKGLLHRVKGQVLKVLGRHEDASESDHELVLYSEGRQYAGTFRPILLELERREIRCLYLSSDVEDPLLTLGSQWVHTRHLGKSYAAWAFLNTLRADVVLMTTPGLDVLQIKRARHVGHYAHVIHAPTDKAFNRPYSFDYFDSVFICGPHQERTIRTLEELRGARKKLLIAAGCVYYDELATAFRQHPASARDGGPLRVLVAPTWGKNGLLTRYGLRVIQPLVEAGFRVTVRPHPQSKTAEAEHLQSLKEESSPYHNLRWDEASSPQAAMQDADILISDISGIIFDYAFLTERPVLTLEFAVEKRGFEASDLPYEPWELTTLELVGRKIREADLPRLAEIVREEADSTARRVQIRAVREEFVLNFGHAAPVVVDEILKLLAREAERREGAALRAVSPAIDKTAPSRA